jgi:hypothetical protein
MRRLAATIATTVLTAALIAPAAQAGQVNGSWAQHGIVSPPRPAAQLNGSWAQHGITKTPARAYTVITAAPPTGDHLINQATAELIAVLAVACALIAARRFASHGARGITRRTVPRSGT